MVKEIYKATLYTGEHFEWKMSWVCRETGLTKKLIDGNTIRIEDCNDDISNPHLLGTDQLILRFKTTYGVSYTVPATHIKQGKKTIITRDRNTAIFRYN